MILILISSLYNKYGVLVRLKISYLPYPHLAILETLLAAKVQAKRIAVIGLTGEGGGLLAPHCDILIDVPSDDVVVFKRCTYPSTIKFVNP